jgi:Zn-dependent M28 family amino/carboxypeptidase
MTLITNRIPLTFLFLSLTVCTCWSQTLSLQSDSVVLNKYLNEISSAALYDHVATLASDAFGGRKMGQPGMDSAVKYLETEFESIGLIKPGNSYRQNFEIFEQYFKTQEIRSGDITLNALPLLRSSLKDSAELIFVGYGTKDDYLGLNVKDKAVAIYKKDLDPDSPFSLQLKNAIKSGAKYLIFVHQEQETYYFAMMKRKAWKPRASLDRIEPKTREMAVENVKEEDFLQFYSPEEREIIQDYTKTGKLKRKQKKQLKKIIHFDFDMRTRAVPTSNIIGIIEGTDLKEEAIILTAHYDHLGEVDGKVYNGADDNASGTAALLEIAKVFTKAKGEGYAPRRTILFAAFSAEEEGLLGSKFYASQPAFPFDNTIANLNFDMIGRVSEAYEDNPNYVYLAGTGDRNTDIYQISEQVVTRHLPGFKLDYSQDGENSSAKLYKRSDQYHFIKNGVPGMLYTDMMQDDYHKASDTADKIDLEQLRKRVQLGFATAWELANRD